MGAGIRHKGIRQAKKAAKTSGKTKAAAAKHHGRMKMARFHPRARGRA